MNCPQILRTSINSTRRLATGLIALLALGSLRAEEMAEATAPAVVITATRLPSEIALVPAMISVVTAQDIAARGAHDLRSALALVGGVDVAAGGDAGPAGSVPGLWGLREFDAFLLVVDGVPAGGAFNPALTTLDLTNVARIEVLRGAAPVLYGATSFVGVIHVIHAAPGESAGSVSASGGSRSSGAMALTTNLPDFGKFKQSLTINGERRGFSQDDASYQRSHALYRAAALLPGGRAHFDLDFTDLRQSPYSPHPREGNVLTGRFPLDANVNPRDGRADVSRTQLNAGLVHDTEFGPWTTVISAARTVSHNTRGFLRGDFATDGVTTNADGFRQRVTITDFYLNSGVAWTLSPELRGALGLDFLAGNGRQTSENFEYAVFPDGRNRPDSHTLHVDEATALRDTRRFGGLYSEVQWTPTSRWHFVAGLRFNYTNEHRAGEVAPTDGTPADRSTDRLTRSRLSGSIGATYKVWGRGASHVTAFADYRNTYKPAAVDFGPEAEGEILQPETAHSAEVGLRGQSATGRFTWEASYFDMDFSNLVIRENIGGLPGLENAGRERFKGAEFEATFTLATDLRATATWAYHDARFTDYARLRPSGAIQQLSGKRLELSPKNLAALGLVYAPERGPRASVVWNRTGSRFLNKGNTAVAAAYDMVDAGVGYAFDRWSIRLDGTNLTDRRDPAAESEIGDAQFYRLPGRMLLLTVTRRL